MALDLHEYHIRGYMMRRGDWMTLFLTLLLVCAARLNAISSLTVIEIALRIPLNE